MGIPRDDDIVFWLSGLIRADGGSVTLLLGGPQAADLSLKLLLPQPVQLSNLRGGSQQRSLCSFG